MPRASDRSLAIRDLTMLCIFAHMNAGTNIPGHDGYQPDPSDGHLLFPNDDHLSNLYDDVFDEEDQWGNMLSVVVSSRYLQPRMRVPPANPFDLRDMLHSRQTDFRQAMRTSPEGFRALLDMICTNPIFVSTSNNRQPPVEQQLAITLERLGSNGNGASVGRFAHNYKVGRGSVINCTRRVISAILEAGSHYIAWPNSHRRKAISKVLERDGFPKCVGFVDGTTIPLFQRPGLNGEVFYDRKHRYSVNVQIICDCDRRITYAYGGWPGSCCDSTVFSKTDVSNNPNKYFDQGEYIIADSAYQPTETVVPSYKGLAAEVQRNREFNWCVAKSRVRNEHAIGILKSRWASLQGLRLGLNERGDMEHVLRWVRSCIILHNMLANLGNAWGNEEGDLVLPERGEAGQDRYCEVVSDLVMIERGRAMRENVRDHAVAYNWENGGLPIVQ